MFRGHWHENHLRLCITSESTIYYALFLDSRIRAYRDLQLDDAISIRAQAESNQDLLTSSPIEDRHPSQKDRSTKSPAASLPTRNKTIMGRKLRSMTGERPVLRNQSSARHDLRFGRVSTIVHNFLCL